MDIENTSKAGSLYKGIFELSPDSIVTLNTKGFITSINSAGAKILGYSVDELIGRHFAKIGYMHIKDIPKYVEIFTAVISGKDVKPLEINLTRKDGTPIVVEVRVGLLKENGKITGIQAITRDVTERKKTEALLQRSEERWRSLVENAPNIIIVVDREGTIQYINRTVAGFSREETVGKKAYDYVEAEHHEAMRKTIEQVFKSGNTGSYVIKGKGPQGRDSWYETLVGPVKSDTQVTAAIMISTDITERKQAEYMLNERHKELGAFYRLAELGERKNTTLSQLYQEFTNTLPQSWQYPEITCVRLAIDGREYRTDNFKETEWQQSAPIYTSGSEAGKLDIYYLEEKPTLDDGPFMQEERQLINALAERIGHISERRLAENLLKDSQESFKLIFEDAPVAYYLNDMKGNFIDGNKEAEKLLEYKKEELAGKSFLKLGILPRDQILKAGGVLAKNMAGLPSGPDELILNRKDKTKIQVEILSRPVNIKGKNLVLGIARDITKRKLAEETLRDSEEKFKALLDSAPDAFFVYDGKGVFVEGNMAAEKLIGYRRDELIGKSFLSTKILSADQLIKGAADLAKNALGIRTQAREYILNRRDGSKVTVEINSTPIKIKGRKYILGVARDLSERRKVEEMLRMDEERYRLAINATREGIWEWNIQNNQEIFSPRWCEIIGYSFDDPELPHTYESWISRIHPDDHDRVISAMKNHLEKGTKYDIDYRHRHKSGEYRWQNSIGQAVRDESGKPVKMVGCISDITERKAAEAVREELLRRIEEANRNKTQFVSDVSHELRTPLASIKGFISTIRSDKEMDEKTRVEFMKIVEDETDRLTRIIEELLDISRIESGRLKLNIRSFDLLELVFKNMENIRKLAEERGVSVEKDVEKGIPPVYADQDKTTQIIINLLSNAIKYNKKGGKVKVVLRKEDGFIRVEVADTGMGISENDLPHMFEKFYRAERTSSEAPGTGLGLALTKNLVEVQGGKISVESKLNKGSKFSFSLPTKGK